MWLWDWEGVQLTICWAGSLRERGSRNDTCGREGDDILREFHGKVGEYNNVYVAVAIAV
jgi:hypothetical protein